MLARRQADEIAATVAELTAGLPVLKIKIYTTEGITIHSSETKQIGEGYGNKLGFRTAPTLCEPVSEFSRHDKFSGFSGEIFNRDIMETYFPVRADDGSVGAIIEIYSDVTPLVKRVERTATNLFVGLLIVFTVLYLALYAIARGADTILRRQYAKLTDSEETIRTQNAELAREIEERRGLTLRWFWRGRRPGRCASRRRRHGGRRFGVSLYVRARQPACAWRSRAR